MTPIRVKFETPIRVKFEYFGEKVRKQNEGEMYLFNKNVLPQYKFFMHHEGETLLYPPTEETRGWAKMIANKGTRIYWINDMEYIELVLKPRKRTFNEGNFNVFHTKIFCVGNKRESTHLPPALLFQKITRRLTEFKW